MKWLGVCAVTACVTITLTVVALGAIAATYKDGEVGCL